MNKSEAINELATALAKAQKDFAPIKRTEHVGFEGKTGGRQYNYAPLDEIIASCRKALSENGLAVLQLTTPTGEDVLRLETVITHSTGQWISSTMDIRASLDKPQDQGSSLTYARRYSLAAILNVASEEDDDAQSAQERGSGKQTRQAERKPPASSPTPTDVHMCKEHNVPFVKHEKDGKIWYSHKNGDGWCNEVKATVISPELDPIWEDNLKGEATEPNLITATQVEVIKDLAKTVPLSATGKDLWPDAKGTLTLMSLPKLPYKSAIVLITEMRKRAAVTNA